MTRRPFDLAKVPRLPELSRLGSYFYQHYSGKRLGAKGLPFAFEAPSGGIDTPHAVRPENERNSH